MNYYVILIVAVISFVIGAIFSLIVSIRAMDKFFKEKGWW